MHSKAFSLIELMVVIAVVALLAAVAVPSYISYKNRTIVSQAMTLADKYITDARTYYLTNGNYSGVTAQTLNNFLTGKTLCSNCGNIAQVDGIFLIDSPTAALPTGAIVVSFTQAFAGDQYQRRIFIVMKDSNGVFNIMCGNGGQGYDLSASLQPANCNQNVGTFYSS